MAKLVFGMNMSLDGFVDHDKFAPDPVLFRHFIEQAKAQTGSLYGRRIYEVMRYWDEEQPGWGEPERAFAAAWRRQPKWVVSGTLDEVGPNATLIRGDLAEAVRALKADHFGEIEVAGPEVAQAVSDFGLLDLYRIYLHPVVLGKGKRFFAGMPPPIRLVAHEPIGDAIRLTYVPAS